ncbi:NBR1-Ig-like domain-containing protein [Micromonospora zamorensis]|uniref:NBR1-Ig-like domain-containing protein n=1 Tax=Micromonospora zamorensis TaxID=709883 RepID=UPI0033AF70EC
MKDQRAAAESIQDRLVAEGFAEQLRTLRTAAGDPSFRKMAGRSGRISHTTLHEAAAGTRFPSWETTREFVRACEADEVQWRRQWEDAQRPGAVHAIPDDGRAQAVGDFPTPAGASHTADAETTDVETPEALDTPADHGPVVSGVAASSPGTPRHRMPWLAAASVVLVVAAVAVLGVTVRGRSSQDRSGTPTASPSSAAFSDSLIPGDSSKFVGDVTIPDGTRVTLNSQFVKVWALQNVGKVDWHNRFLARMNATADDDGCQTPDRVAIGDTPPGEQVMISVQVTAPSHPGKCWVSWKMVDENGQEFFPSRRPVYFMVNVIA